MLGRLSRVLAALTLATYTVARPPTVDLGYASYAGNYLQESAQNEFLGIRFAAPPVGKNRFRAPQPPGYLGSQNATTFPPLCYATNLPVNTTGRSEDCLFLNVYAPSNLERNKKVPVWLWIQGGGYSDNSNGNYNASKLITATNNNMVVVSFQYRVNLYGFLASQDVKNNGDLNAGMLDQRAVMLWVQKYISKFGGDPSRVVIVGASAGAGSVAMHLLSYGGKGHPNGESKKPLFIGAVGISPAIGGESHLSDLEWQYNLILSRTNCTTGRLACLRSLDIAKLQAANLPISFPGRSGPAFTPYTPCVDGEFLEDYPHRLVENGKFLKVPVIFGDDTDEGSYFVPNAATASEVTSFIQDQSPKITDAQVATILTQYPLESNPTTAQHNEYFGVVSKAFGEVAFICSGIKLDTAYRNAGVPSWTYRYDVITELYAAYGLGSPHTSELTNIYEGIPAIGDLYPARPIDAPNLVKPLQAYYSNFVRFLDPNGPTRGAETGLQVPLAWPKFNATLPRLLFQADGIKLEKIPQAQLDRCAFWETLIATTIS